MAGKIRKAPAAEGKRNLPRWILGHAIFTALLLGGIFGAWKLHTSLRIGQDEPDSSSGSALPSLTGGSALLNLEEFPGAGEAFDGDPGDLAPPEGANRVWSGRDRQEEILRTSARYQWAGSAREVVDHYSRLLISRGYRLVLTSQNPSRPLKMAWRKGPHLAVLFLRRSRPEDTMVAYLISIWTPSGIATPTGAENG